MQALFFKVIKAISTIVIVAYLLLRGLETMVFMPFAIPPTDWQFWFFGGLYLAAIAISIGAYFGNYAAASLGVIAYVVCSISFYFFVTYGGRFVLSDFYWAVPPDLIFAVFIWLRMYPRKSIAIDHVHRAE